jgi:hypothetical protein
VSIAIAASAPRTALAPGPRIRSVLTLALIEGRLLIKHPAILVGPGLILLIAGRGPDVFHFFFMSGFGYFIIGIGTFLAANLCATRSRRDKTDELYEALPLRPSDRTAAQLLSLAFPLAAALLIAAALAMTTRPWSGASVRLDEEPLTIMHGLPDFAQGPLLIAFLGAAGILLARWFIAPVAVAVVFAGITGFNFLTGLSHGALHWLNAVSSYSSTSLEPASTMTWHLVYLMGLILLLGLAALVRRPLARGLMVYGTAAFTLTAVGGVMQVLAASA